MAADRIGEIRESGRGNMTEEEREKKHHRLRRWRTRKITFSFLPLIASLFMSLIFVGSAGGGIPLNACVHPTGCNFNSGPITFDISVNSTSTSDRTAQANITITKPELLVVAIPSEAGSVLTASHEVNAVFDSIGTSYAFSVHAQSVTSVSWESYDLYYAFVPVGTITVFVSWLHGDTTNRQRFFLNTYRNAFGLGNTAHLDNVTLPPGGTTKTVNIVESKNSGWIVGGAIVSDGSKCLISPGAGQNQRAVSYYDVTPTVVADTQDKGPLAAPGSYPYSEIFSNPCNPVQSQVALVGAEVIPQVDEQLNECTSTNGLCGSTPQGPNTVSCTVALGGSSCTTALISFSPAYVNKPLISAFETLNPLGPNHLYTFPGATVSNLITFQTPGNNTRLLVDDENLVTIPIPNVDTAMKQYSPSGIEPGPVIVEGEGYVKTTNAPASLGQDVSIKINDCNSATIIQTIKFNPESVVASGKIPFAIKALVPMNVFNILCVSISVQAPAADANTLITLVSIRVYQLQNNFQTWINMPSAATEIYGTANNEQKFAFQASNGVTMYFCVNIISLSTSATAVLTPYVNGAELSTNLRVSVGAGSFTGLICSSANVNLSAGIFPVTVFGINGAGVGDLPTFGAISLTWQQINPNQNVLINVAYSPPIIVAETNTSFQLKIQFSQTLSAANTVTFTWSSIGT